MWLLVVFLFEPGQIRYRAGVRLSKISKVKIYTPPPNEIPGYAPGQRSGPPLSPKVEVVLKPLMAQPCFGMKVVNDEKEKKSSKDEILREKIWKFVRSFRYGGCSKDACY